MLPESPRPTPQLDPSDEPRLVVEMGGSNLVIRSTIDLDHADTDSLVSALNAATDADVDVVIDPASVRCDEAFASLTHRRTAEERSAARPVAAEFAAVGVIRLAGEGTCWTIDVAGGRLCRTDVAHDVRFLGPEAWTPMVAVCVTHDRLVALTGDGRHLSERRAHHDVGPDAPPRSLRVA
ncbi:MAG: hypothetical protein CL424_07930 [Acidimicrobiaceae bacterium]|nr:hypothetical protein [Acidimicrobiaceae bacterium]